VQEIVAYSQQKVLMVIQMRELFYHLANAMQEKFHTWHKLALFSQSLEFGKHSSEEDLDHHL
jgi:hypothetical protein